MANLLKINKTKNAPVYKFRDIKDSDLPAIINIEHEAQKIPWTIKMFRDCLQAGYTCWVLEDKTGIIGFIIFSITAHECNILNLCIKPNKQKQDYGYMLLKQALQYAKQNNAATAFLETRRSNKAAFNLYRKIGFRETGVRKNYYPAKNGREDAIMLKLILS